MELQLLEAYILRSQLIQLTEEEHNVFSCSDSNRYVSPINYIEYIDSIFFDIKYDPVFFDMVTNFGRVNQNIKEAPDGEEFLGFSKFAIFQVGFS